MCSHTHHRTAAVWSRGKKRASSRISQALDSQTNSQKKKYNYKFNDLNPKAVSVDAAKTMRNVKHGWRTALETYTRLERNVREGEPDWLSNGNAAVVLIAESVLKLRWMLMQGDGERHWETPPRQASQLHITHVLLGNRLRSLESPFSLRRLPLSAPQLNFVQYSSRFACFSRELPMPALFAHCSISPGISRTLSSPFTFSFDTRRSRSAVGCECCGNYMTVIHECKNRSQLTGGSENFAFHKLAEYCAWLRHLDVNFFFGAAASNISSRRYFVLFCAKFFSLPVSRSSSRSVVVWQVSRWVIFSSFRCYNIFWSVFLVFEQLRITLKSELKRQCRRRKVIVTRFT